MNELLFLLNGISALLLVLIFLSEKKIKNKDYFYHKLCAIKTNKEVIKKFSFPVEKKLWGACEEVTIDYLILTGNNLICVKYISKVGFIYGNEARKIWWSISNKNKKEEILNPMEIIYNQSVALKKTIHKDVEIIPAVVFKDSCNLDYVYKSVPDILLMKESEFYKYIKNIHFGKGMSKSELKKLKKKLVFLGTQKNSNATR